MHHHHLGWDLIYWLVFACGVFLFLLKRADLARRSPLNGVKSIGEYFSLNWVVLLYRFAFESALLWAYRHPETPSDLGLHFNLPHITQSLVLAFFGGLFASSLLDYILGQDKFLGIPIPGWIKEFIPQLPDVQLLVASLAVQKASVASAEVKL